MTSPFENPAADVQALDANRFSHDNICLLLGIPSRMIGFDQPPRWANAEAIAMAALPKAGDTE